MQTKNWYTYRAYLGVILVVCSVYVHAADNVKVTVKSNVTEGSCALSGPGAQPFLYGHMGSEFTPSQRTVETMILNITVKCKGSVAGKKGTIQVTGPLLQGQTDIFSAPKSTASHVGVAVREGVYSGALSQFYTPGEVVSKANPDTYVGQVDAVNGGVYPYTLGLVSDGTTPGLGTVNATLTFEIKYQ
ncbi:TPA: fimbrial protein [Serratia marcescens]|uniref:Fimbrial protein n=2 Tax=Serratia TaxID=613 RepID=A0A9X8VHT4_SERMA|nr:MULTISPECIES: fimbrial protein [Serratia]MBS3894518.1 fimbrial protein [Serratia marcescens]TXE22530.1 fimbrial protein [Serratia ureilytica]HBC7422440.1 fimbrial protein [Serratia marcescens]